MKKVLALSLAVAFAVGAMAGPAVAGEPKVDVCHLNSASDPIPTFNPDTDLRMFYLGREISVAPAAVDAHVAHGDSTTYRTDAGGLANVFQSAANNGLEAWKNADCFVTVEP